LRRGGNYDVQSVEESRINGSGELVKYKRYFIRKAEGAVSCG
jgi:hypothetical protein